VCKLVSYHVQQLCLRKFCAQPSLCRLRRLSLSMHDISSFALEPIRLLLKLLNKIATITTWNELIIQLCMQPFLCRAWGLSHLCAQTDYHFVRAMIQALPQNPMTVTTKLSNRKHLITTMLYICNNYAELTIHAQPNIIMYQFHKQNSISIHMLNNI
jgi:hypothetical protein